MLLSFCFTDVVISVVIIFYKFNSSLHTVIHPENVFSELPFFL